MLSLENVLKEILPIYNRYMMNSIHTNKEYEQEYKQQFRNMTDEQIEQHIKLQRLRNIIDGYPKEYGIEQIRKLIKEVREERNKQQ